MLFLFIERYSKREKGERTSKTIQTQQAEILVTGNFFKSIYVSLFNVLQIFPFET